MNVLAAIRQSSGDLLSATSDYERAIETAGPDLYSKVEAMIGIAAVAERVGQPNRALDHARAALEVAGRVGYRVHEGCALTVIAQTHLQQGQIGPARESGEHALAIHRSTGHRLGEAQTLAVLGRLAKLTGDEVAARYWLRASRKLFTDVGAPVPAGVGDEPS